MTSEEVAKLTDGDLYVKCQVCGSSIRKLQKEFACYLPEVERRGLHKKYGFYSIYEYAGRLAGMNHATVDAIMSVHGKLIDKPVLKDLMADSGWGKLKVVTAVATPENQSFWAKKIKEMSKATLVTYVREMKRQEGARASEKGNTQTGLFTDIGNASELGTGSSKPMAVSQKLTLAFKLDGEVEMKLRIFKQKLEKKTHEPMDWNETMKELLKIAEEHENCGKKRAARGRAVQKQSGRPATRHIPAHVKKQLQQKYGGKCAFPGCKKPADINHHTKRFALEPCHNPDSITPLCKDHERIAHCGLIKNEEQFPEKWRLLQEPHKNLPKFAVDRIVQRHYAPGEAARSPGLHTIAPA